jgi:uncharacterized Zn finger protein (UPF0148 family)
MSHKRSLRFSKATCPFCGSREVARDEHKGDLICTNCGNIVTRRDSRSISKFELAQILKREGNMTFERLREITSASDDKLYGSLESMVDMGLVDQIGGKYRLSKRGQRWYRQRLGQEWGY